MKLAVRHAMKNSMRQIATLLPLLLASCTHDGAPEDAARGGSAIVAGAGFTTFDESMQGCLDSPNGINCNNYAFKGAVFMSGGPSAGALSDGEYYFAVLAPGHQNAGFMEGADGNLSDMTAGATSGDLGSGDSIANRTFSMAGGQIAAYAGTHAWGMSPNGRPLLQLAPFDDTDNAGGVYILAICRSGAMSSSECKFDAFRLHDNQIGGGDGGSDGGAHFAELSGAKYYDANANGQLDAGEPMIPSWPIRFSDMPGDVLMTGADGAFSLELLAGDYHFSEILPMAGSPWMQTGNLVDQATASGGASEALLPDRSYLVTAADNSSVSGLYFGNLCLGAGNGRTLGFWSNKNGKAMIGADDLGMLCSLNLRQGSGASFDPADYAALRAWLLSATATNMAYMLSAQLATMELNVLNGLVQGGRLIFAPGAACANGNGFASVAAVMNEANQSLGASGSTPSSSAERAHQEALKNALDRANNDLNFVQQGPAACPVPAFP